MMGSKREDWLIEIRDDNRDGTPEVVARSEYVFRGREGARHVDLALPPIKTALENIEDIPVTLSDGHRTTLGVVVAALRQAAREAIDQHEVDLPKDIGERRPGCFAKNLRKHQSRHGVK